MKGSLGGHAIPSKVCVLAEGGGEQGGLDGDVGDGADLKRAGTGRAKVIMVLSGERGGEEDAVAMLRASVAAQLYPRARVLVQVGITVHASLY